MAGAAACLAQRLSPRQRLWVLARQCEKLAGAGAASATSRDRRPGTPNKAGFQVSPVPSPSADPGLDPPGVAIRVVVANLKNDHPLHRGGPNSL